MKAQLERIRQDVQCGQGRIGPASASRLFDLLDEMIQRLETLERQDHERRMTVGGGWDGG